MAYLVYWNDRPYACCSSRLEALMLMRWLERRQPGSPVAVLPS